MLNKTKEVKKADKHSSDQYIALAVFTAALAVLIYGVPAIGNTLLCAVSGALCIAVMAVCVFKGGLTDAGE